MSRCEHIWLGDGDDRMICTNCGELQDRLPFMIQEDDPVAFGDTYWNFRGSK